MTPFPANVAPYPWAFFVACDDVIEINAIAPDSGQSRFEPRIGKVQTFPPYGYAAFEFERTGGITAQTPWFEISVLPMIIPIPKDRGSRYRLLIQSQTGVTLTADSRPLLAYSTQVAPQFTIAPL